MSSKAMLSQAQVIKGSSLSGTCICDCFLLRTGHLWFSSLRHVWYKVLLFSGTCNLRLFSHRHRSSNVFFSLRHRSYKVLLSQAQVMKGSSLSGTCHLRLCSLRHRWSKVLLSQVHVICGCFLSGTGHLWLSSLRHMWDKVLFFQEHVI